MLPVTAPAGRPAEHRGAEVWSARMEERERTPFNSLTRSTEEGDIKMGIGVSLFLLAVGAVLAFVVHVENSGGFDINTIGVILMVVGAVGLIVSMIFWSSWGGFGHRGVAGDDVVVRE